jgi:hypothetical protein
MNITAALKLAKELRALVKLRVITKRDANKHFRRYHGINLYKHIRRRP